MADKPKLQQFPDPRSIVKPQQEPKLRSDGEILASIENKLDAILWALGGPEVASINKTGYMLRAAAAQQAQAEKPRIVVPE